MSNIQVSKLNTLRGHNHSVFALTNGCQSDLIYTGSGDGMVVEWNLSVPGDGLLLAKLPNSVYALCVDQKRNILFIGQNNEGIHAIDLKSKKEIWTLKITSQAIFDLKVLDNLLLAATGDGVLVVIDIEERSPVRHVKISDQSLRVLAISPDKSQVSVGASDHLVKVFDTKDWSPLARMQGHLNSVFALAYSPDGTMIVSGGRDATLKFWDTNKFEQQQNIAAHMYAINYLSFREDGKYFVTCSMDKSIKVWSLEEFKLLKVIDKARYVGHGTSVNKVLWTNNYNQVVAISDDHTVSVWEINISQ